MVYDITKASSFKTLKTWIDELKTQGPKDIAIAIAGNKADLADRRVRTDGDHVDSTDCLLYAAGGGQADGNTVRNGHSSIVHRD